MYETFLRILNALFFGVILKTQLLSFTKAFLTCEKLLKTLGQLIIPRSVYSGH